MSVQMRHFKLAMEHYERKWQKLSNQKVCSNNSDGIVRTHMCLQPIVALGFKRSINLDYQIYWA